MLLRMTLPLRAPVPPMLSKAVDAIPDGDGWLFEPKWDGFRCVVFRDGDNVQLQSRDLKPLQRYFPEILEPLQKALPDRCVVDGELVIAHQGVLDFGALLQRIHPAATRINQLAAETPCSFVAWDLLALGDQNLLELPFVQRRQHLETVLRDVKPPIHLTPSTSDRALAQDWFLRFEGAGLDGVMAKRVEEPYAPGKRTMLKIKHQRTADCVVAGFRWHKNGPQTMVGSFLLGLHDDTGTLQHVGIAASFTTARRKELVEELAPLRVNALEGHPWRAWREHDLAQRTPGAGSRWSRGKDLSWEPLRAERVCEVSYDHLQGARFRHGTHFLRWRPDKAPADCRYDQLEQTPAYELQQIFARG
jgi:ATP-dependent DNA ligase